MSSSSFLPYCEFTATKISSWASTGISPRHRLAVFLRVLIHSTGKGLSRVYFPGNDDAERHGSDGIVEATEATSWIPKGHSVWEFSVQKDKVNDKANHDFNKSVKAFSADDRKDMTFIFVTPHSWKDKGEWAKEKNKETPWKNVCAYDASDLEQWLEQSTPAQIWFAEETGQTIEGVISLDKAQANWQADCQPPLDPSLFTFALKAHCPSLQEAITDTTHRPVTIEADSPEEACAFLSAAFPQQNPKRCKIRDRILIFNKVDALSKCVAHSLNFIPVILGREVEAEFAPHSTTMPSFIIYPRNFPISPNITLEILTPCAFHEALSKMGLRAECIQSLSRKTGRSLTVLRRQLSNLPAIRTPPWASDISLAASLVPFLFAGAWNANNDSDKQTLKELAGNISFEELERRLNTLRLLPSSPVWQVGSSWGMVSQLETLFALQNQIINTDLERFFNYFRGAKMGGISNQLHRGLDDMLLLLSVHGQELFGTRLSIDTTRQAQKLVETSLKPLTLEKLKSQSGNLQLYAEAAPETFLSIIEADLKQDQPASLALIQTVYNNSLFAALEILAWDDDLFIRTVHVLGRLSQSKVENKPDPEPTSLSNIFHFTQTNAELEGRKIALSNLAKQFPDIAWPICIAQFLPYGKIGSLNHTPRFRPYGNIRTTSERYDLALHAITLALEWPNHTQSTLGDLIKNLEVLDEEQRLQVWNQVNEWMEKASKEDHAKDLTKDIAWLCEQIRVTPSYHHCNRAREIYEKYLPSDPVYRYAPLFDQSWSPIPANERETEAVLTTFQNGGVDAVIRLAEINKKAWEVGHSLLSSLLSSGADDGELIAVLKQIVNGEPITGIKAELVSGALHEALKSEREILGPLIAGESADTAMSILLEAPFCHSTWNLLKGLGKELDKRYWEQVTPLPPHTDEVCYAVEKLCDAGRPCAAFNSLQGLFQHLPSRDLFTLLDAISRGSDEAADIKKINPQKIQEAFQLLNKWQKLLNDRREIPTDKMADLEFRFIHALSVNQNPGLVNLSQEIATNPERFVEAVKFAHSREDAGEDASEAEISEAEISDEQKCARSDAYYQLLHSLRVIPGYDEKGIDEKSELLPQRIIEWVKRVRKGYVAIARSKRGDWYLGHLLSHAPKGEDDIWPCMPVRDALQKVYEEEQVHNEELTAGLIAGRHNSYQAGYSGSAGGSEQRTLAAEVESWAEALKYTHPHVASILRKLKEDYLKDAQSTDHDAKEIQRRIR